MKIRVNRDNKPSAFFRDIERASPRDPFLIFFSIIFFLRIRIKNRSRKIKEEGKRRDLGAQEAAPQKRHRRLDRVYIGSREDIEAVQFVRSRSEPSGSVRDVAL
jgi:hypothetical protein